MKVTTVTNLFVSGLLLVAMGCGGGGGGGAATGAAPGSAVLSGSASKGPISGGTVQVFEIISSSTSNPRSSIPRLGSAIAQGTTGADGSYNITLPPGTTKGGLLVQVTGGTYKDEATGAILKVDDQFGPSGLRAAFGNISGAARRSGQLSGSVTPFTEMAYKGSGGNLTDQALDDSNRRVATAFGLPDIIKTTPLDPTKPFPSGSSADEHKYALALASLSQYQKDFSQSGTTMASLEDALEAEISGGGLSAQTDSQFKSSSNNFAAGGSNPNPILDTPGENPNAPALVSVTPAATALSIGSSTSIQALVKKSDGTPVPDGTLVSFTSSFGTLSAASAGTVSGLASTTLSSAAPGSATVTAKSGSATGSSAPIAFSDPNAAVSMTLSASASQGIANGAAVLISANVSRVAGGPVPDGSSVSFSVTSGAGTLSGASTTSNGIATVNLSSSAAGTVSLSASMGGVSQSIGIPFVTQPTRAIVKVLTTGTLPANTLIGGVGATVLYSTNKGLSILASNISTSGGGVGSTLVPNVNTLGQAVLGLINVSGIPAGEFATLNFAIAAGNFPTAADFSISGSGLSIIDTTTLNIPGMGAAIASVTIL